MNRMIIGATMLALVIGTAMVAEAGQNRRQNQQNDASPWHEQSRP
jgi:hypothetical protein